MVLENQPSPIYSGLRPKERYEFSLNPSDAYQFETCENRFQMFRENMEFFLNKYFAPYTDAFEFFYELSDPHVNITEGKHWPRWHVHGSVIFNKPMTWRDLVLPKLSQLMLITFNNFRPDYWPEYCTKNAAETAEYTSNRGVITRPQIIKLYARESNAINPKDYFFELGRDLDNKSSGVALLPGGNPKRKNRK